jgi:mannose-6-phosphate isomerase-like protein (cupin superfamily)
MSDYTRLNLKDDVDNAAPKFGMPPEMEARFGRRALGMERTGVSHFTLAPNFRIPFGHTHTSQEEVYVVVKGSARIKVGDEVLELGPFDAVRVAAGVVRNLEGGPEGVEYLAFGEAAGNDDSEMIPGWWSSNGS